MINLKVILNRSGLTRNLILLTKFHYQNFNDPKLEKNMKILLESLRKKQGQNEVNEASVEQTEEKFININDTTDKLNVNDKPQTSPNLPKSSEKIYSFQEALFILKKMSSPYESKPIIMNLKLTIDPIKLDQRLFGKFLPPKLITEQNSHYFLTTDKIKDKINAAGFTPIEIKDLNPDNFRENPFKYHNLNVSREYFSKCKINARTLLNNHEGIKLFKEEKVDEIIDSLKKGEIIMDFTRSNIVSLIIGYDNFTEREIMNNLDSCLKYLVGIKPLSLKAKRYFSLLTLKTENSDIYKVNSQEIHPLSPHYFMNSIEEIEANYAKFEKEHDEDIISIQNKL